MGQSVKIYRPAKNAMQSGKKNTTKWILEHIRDDSKYIDPIMGWTGNKNTLDQIKIKFDSMEDAVNYAKRNGFEYNVVLPHAQKTIIRAYSDNFTS